MAGQKEEEIQKEVIEERQEGDQRKEGKTFKEGTRKAGERGTTCTCKEGKGTVGPREERSARFIVSLVVVVCDFLVDIGLCAIAFFIKKIFKSYIIYLNPE